MDGLVTQVARRAQRTTLACKQTRNKAGATDAPLSNIEHVAKGTGPPKKEGPFEAITSGVRGPP